MPVAAEDLLKHAAFVRAMARSLLLDPHAADDVVQETWLTALEAPPRHAENLRGWLTRQTSSHGEREVLLPGLPAGTYDVMFLVYTGGYLQMNFDHRVVEVDGSRDVDLVYDLRQE